MNIINMLDDYLLSESNRPRTSHHPSDVTSCLRQMYYKWNNVPKTNPPTAGNMIKMRFGDGAETIIENWLKAEVEAGRFESYTTQNEITGIEPDLAYRIHGYEDFVVQGKDGSFGIECKSSFGRGIRWIKDNGPKEEHVLQVYQYMRYGTQDHYFLIYIARDDGYRTQFECTYDRQTDKLYVNGTHWPVDWNYYLNRLIASEHTIGAAVLPDREFKAVIKDGEIKDKVQRNGKIYNTIWNCSYCDWKDLCYKKQLDYSAKYGKILYGGEEI